MNTANDFEPIAVLESPELARESVSVASPKTRKPRLWTAFVTFLVAAVVGQLAVIAAVVAAGAVAGFIMAASGGGGAEIQARVQEFFQQPLLAMLFSLIPCQLGMAVVVLFAASRSKEPIKQRLGFTPQTGRTFGGLKLATMAAFTMSIGLASLVFSSLLLGPAPSNNPIGAAIADGSWWTITLLSLILSVIPALVEESLFRGYLQRRLLERWSPAVAISVSSLLFAVMHMDSLHHVISVVPLAIVTGLLAYRTNSTKPGMLVHAVHNTGVVGFSALAIVLAAYVDQETLGMLLIGAIGVLGLIGLPAVVSLVRSAKRQPLAETQAAAEAVVGTLSPRSGAMSLPNFLTDSRLARPAV